MASLEKDVTIRVMKVVAVTYGYDQNSFSRVTLMTSSVFSDDIMSSSKSEVNITIILCPTFGVHIPVLNL